MDKYDYKTMFDLIENSTYVENVNNGVTIANGGYFGAMTAEGMAYLKKSMYNDIKDPNDIYQDTTKIQSNFNNLNSIGSKKK